MKIRLTDLSLIGIIEEYLKIQIKNNLLEIEVKTLKEKLKTSNRSVSLQKQTGLPIVIKTNAKTKKAK